MTHLRTKSSQLVEQLLRGDKVSLIHRSKLIGVISPVSSQTKKFNTTEFLKTIKSIKRKRTTDKERKDTYSHHLTKKYGKDIS